MTTKTRTASTPRIHICTSGCNVHSDQPVPAIPAETSVVQPLWKVPASKLSK